jgi:hypothetical protein
MKHLILALSLVLMFTGCDFEEQKPGISTIKNTSANFDVSYHFKDNLPHITTKNSENTYERPLYDYIQSYEPSKRVLLKTEYPHENDVVYIFSERQSYTVKINNAIGENVTFLSAGGWIDEMKDIMPGSADDANHTGRIYTDKPVFTVTTASGFPAEVAYNFINDTFMVTIKWGN